jgi:hypothetical protein
VVRNARHPYPRRLDGEKWIVKGRGTGDRPVQVVFLLDPDGTVFVIHAMPLTPRQQQRERRRM